ncbi:hypothetical protein VTI74DRAFT_5544 [Chaetomium olivicolor]
MTDTHSHPLFLSPALPSDLLQFIIARCSYPTTLVICGDRAEFLSSLTQDLIRQQQHNHEAPHTADKPHDLPAQQATADLSNPPQDYPRAANHRPDHPPPHAEQQPQPETNRSPTRPHPLLTPSLAQLSTTRHIRTLFIPTVSHLHAFLSVFPAPLNPSAGKAPPSPPPPPSISDGTSRKGKNPFLVVYNFLALHRHTSEWSVQGLGASAAVLVEAGSRAGVGVAVAEGLPVPLAPAHGDTTCGTGEGEVLGRKGPEAWMREVLGERVPVLSGSLRRAGGAEMEGSGWAGKTVDVWRVLGRWFRISEEGVGGG